MRIFIADVETIDRGGPLRRAAFDRTGVTRYQAIEVRPGRFLVACPDLDAAPAGTVDVTDLVSRPLTKAQANAIGSRLGVDPVPLRGLTIGQVVLMVMDGAEWAPTVDNRIRFGLSGITLYDAPAIQGGATDTFTYSNGRLSTVSSSAWTDSSSNMVVSSNAVVYSAASSSANAFHQTALTANDHYAQIDVTPGDGEYAAGGVIIRGNGNATAGSATGYRCEFGCWSAGPLDHHVAITRLDGGSTTEVASTRQGAEDTSSHFLYVEVSGNTITIDVDGAEELVYTSASSYTTQKYTGIYAGRYSGDAVTIDNFESGNLGGTTGTGAPTMARHTAAGSGSTAAGGITGTSATTLQRVTAAGSGSTAQPPVTGTSASTLARHSGSGAGSATAAATAWFEDFTDASTGTNNWLPRTGYSSPTADSTWKTYNDGAGFDVLYGDFGSDSASHVVRDTGSTQLVVKGRYKMSSGSTSVGGLVIKAVSDTKYVGMELIITAEPENKVTFFTRDGATYDEFAEFGQVHGVGTSYGLVQETWYDLELIYETGGFISGKIDGELVLDRYELDSTFNSAISATTNAGAIRYANYNNYDALGAGPYSGGVSATTLARHTAAGSGSTAAGGITGTSATTLVRHTAAGSGSTGTSGSSATTLVRHAAAGSGTSTPPAGIGAGSPALARNTAAGAGSTGNTGASATTLQRATAAGSGTATAPSVTGSSAVTLTRHAGAGSGTTAAPTSPGTGAPVLARHTAEGSGSTGTTGSGATTCTRHTAAGSGTTTGLVSTSAVTMLRHTASGVGTSTPPSFAGVGAATLERRVAAGVGQTGTTGTGALTLTRHTAVGSDIFVTITGRLTTSGSTVHRTTTTTTTRRSTSHTDTSRTTSEAF